MPLAASDERSNRNLLLLNQLYWQAGRKSEAQKVLLERSRSPTAPALSTTL
jgi:ATP/maltotriose-dependent transcriptional regulator MalT